jgi:isocitrate lyase
MQAIWVREILFLNRSVCKSEVDPGLQKKLQLTTEIVGSVGIPVMADGEDGFGAPDTARETFEAFIEAGGGPDSLHGA